MNTPTTLWYFVDPMCSWCWGFSPVMDEIKKTYGNHLKVAMMLGGLRPGTTEPMTQESREEIFHHWREVQKLTGQTINAEGALPEGFVYDTEPACRAVIAVSEISAESTLPYYKKVQQAFYLGQKDVTDVRVLTELAADFAIEAQDFTEHFNGDDARNKTQLYFQQTRKMGVRGFPTLVMQLGSKFKLIANGYRPFEEIKPEIDAWLHEHGGTKS